MYTLFDVDYQRPIYGKDGQPLRFADQAAAERAAHIVFANMQLTSGGGEPSQLEVRGPSDEVILRLSDRDV